MRPSFGRGEGSYLNTLLRQATRPSGETAIFDANFIVVTLKSTAKLYWQAGVIFYSVKCLVR